MVTEEGCTYLASALRSNPSHLMELDLRYNHPGDSGEKLLSDLRADPHYKQSKLNLDHGGGLRIKPGFRKYACELTLNPQTSHKNLVLSEGNRQVTWMEDDRPHLHHAGRSDHHQLVLCEQGLTGRHYWEVEVLGPLSIGVTGKREEWMGQSQDSWCLVCSDDVFYILHNTFRVDVSSLGWRTSRVGVYLDWPAGSLSFYRVSSDNWIHLHTYKLVFTEPLYPAVQLQPQSSAVFSQLM